MHQVHRSQIYPLNIAIQIQERFSSYQWKGSHTNRSRNTNRYIRYVRNDIYIVIRSPNSFLWNTIWTLMWNCFIARYEHITDKIKRNVVPYRVSSHSIINSSTDVPLPVPKLIT